MSSSTRRVPGVRVPWRIIRRSSDQICSTTVDVRLRRKVSCSAFIGEGVGECVGELSVVYPKLSDESLYARFDAGLTPSTGGVIDIRQTSGPPSSPRCQPTHPSSGHGTYLHLLLVSSVTV